MFFSAKLTRLEHHFEWLFLKKTRGESQLPHGCQVTLGCNGSMTSSWLKISGHSLSIQMSTSAFFTKHIDTKNLYCVIPHEVLFGIIEEAILELGRQHFRVRVALLLSISLMCSIITLRLHMSPETAIKWPVYCLLYSPNA